MSNIITGLDIGSSSIKGVVAGTGKDGRLSIVTVFKHPSAGFHKGVLIDADEAVSVLHDIARDLEKISKGAVKNVYINVNSEHIKARASRGIVAVARSDQEIQEEDVDRVIQASRAVKLLPNHSVLHNITREYFVDDVGDILDPISMTGSRLEVSTLIIEGFSPQVTFLTKHVEHAGLRIGGLIFNPLASARAVLSKRQKDLGSVLIDFGADTTTLVVYEENKVSHTKSIPLGSSYITKDIAIGLKTSFDVAEELKVSYGYALSKDVSRKDTVKLSEFDPDSKDEVSRRFLSEIIEVRLAEILDLVNNELKSIDCAGRLPGGAVITGGGVKLEGIGDLVKQTLKLPVQTGISNLGTFEVMNPTHQSLLEDPEFSTAAGLALWGTEGRARMEYNPQNLVKTIFKNLMP